MPTFGVLKGFLIITEIPCAVSIWYISQQNTSFNYHKIFAIR